ncbi:MAG: hypothetical protein ACLFPS_07890 [Clostridia bacterium]
MNKQDFLKIVKTSKKHPVFFVENVLGDKLWKKQKQILNTVQNHNVSVASCHGAGKSFTASRVVIHAMSVMPGTQIITTAPTNRQVKKVLWKEIRTGYKRSNFPLGGKMLTQEWQIDDDWFALGFATSDTDSFQGFHGKRVLVVADEAAGVDETIFNGIDGITSGANSRILYIGNPTSRAGRFYQSHSSSDQFKKFNISAFDTPNFTDFNITLEDIATGKWVDKVPDNQNDLPYPQLVTPQWVADRYETWGVDSALWQAKVMGKFPQDEEYTIVPVYIWKQAQVPEDAVIGIDDIEDVRIGIDVARFGSDQTSLSITIKDRLVSVETIQDMDTTEVSKWADRIIRKRFNRFKRWKQVHINIDAIGVGAGVADQLKNNYGYENAYGFKVSEKAVNYDKYLNKRAEMYWQFRQGLKDGTFEIGVHDEEIENQMTAIKYEFSSNGLLKVESKKKIKKRIGESPDTADSICMAFYKRRKERHKSGNGFYNAWTKG